MSRLFGAVTFATMLVLATAGNSATRDVCDNSWDHLIVEVTIAVGFENDLLNTEEMFSKLQPRVTHASQRHGWPWNTHSGRVMDGRHVGTYCIDLGSFEDITFVPADFLFWLGPRSIPFKLGELASLAEPILARGSDTSTSGANVIRVTQTIELDSQSDPDWVAIEVAELVRLADGKITLNLRAHNQGQLRSTDVPVELYATNAGAIRCAAAVQPTSGSIRLRQVDGLWVGTSTEIAFGDEQTREVSIENGACGELDLQMSLGSLPAMNERESLLVSFVFADVVTGPGAGLPFWDVFHEGGSIRMKGEGTWPKSVRLDVP